MNRDYQAMTVDSHFGIHRLIALQNEWQEREPTMADRGEVELIKAAAQCEIAQELASIRRIYDQATERHYT